MKFTPTKIHCPHCGDAYVVDPEVYGTHCLITCVCGCEWNADTELEELLLYTYRDENWDSCFYCIFLSSILIPFLLLVILYILFFIGYRKSIKMWKLSQTDPRFAPFTRELENKKNMKRLLRDTTLRVFLTIIILIVLIVTVRFCCIFLDRF